MYDLTSRNLKALANFLLRLYVADSRDSYINTILTGIKSLVPCCYTSYNEIDIPARKTFYKSHGADETLYQSIQPAFKAYLHQHPWGQRVLTTPDYGVHTVSDFMPDRVFRRLDLYQEYYRHLGISRQLGVSLSVPPSLFIPIVINRDGRDYGSRERQMLDVLRPHLTQAFHNAHAWERMSERRSSFQRLFQTLDKALVETDRYGKILWTSPGADSFFLRHRLRDSKPSAYLPSTLLDWMLNAVRKREPQSVLSTPAKPLRLRTASGTLTIHLVEAAERVRLLLEDRSETLPSDDELASQLSPREQEVLRILATGRSNDQIARLLGISRRTVQKHLERIYERLGVENRTAAVGRLWELTASES
jgi:DNA-binding CsgD family transcriptional regulator